MLQSPFKALPSIQNWVIVIFIGMVSLASTHAQEITPNELLVKFRTSATKPTDQSLSSLAYKFGVTKTEAFLPPRRTKPAGNHPFTNLYKIQLTGDPIAAAQAYASNPNVEYAQPNHLFYPLDTPNDPRYTDQYALTNINWQTLYDALGPIQKQVIIAILDSGIDDTHEDLQANRWQNSAEANGLPNIDDDGNGYIDDIYGWDFTDAPNIPGFGDSKDRDNNLKDESSHGTNIAGIIAATANNNLGVVGVAPDAQIMPIRASASLLAGGSFLQEDDLAAGILYAVENGAHIINMSWGGPESALVIRDALQYAASNGLVLVAAAGNSGEPGLSYPAANNNTIAVGATDRSNNLTNFSSTGTAIDVVAPGLSILTTQLGNTYTVRSGTSMSAPQVSALAALLLSRNPDLTPKQIRSLLISTAKDLGSPGYDNNYGAGLIDADALATSINTVPPTVEILSPENTQSVTGNVPITLQLTGSTMTTYRLSYGIGPQPNSWTALASGTPSETLEHTWNTAGIQDTVLVLRLEALLANGKTLEDRIEVHKQGSPPSISALSYGPTLDGPNLRYEFRWTTDQLALGGVAYKAFGSSNFDTLYTGRVFTEHRLSLPPDLATGPMTIHVFAQGTNGQTGQVTPDPFTYSPFRVPTNGYTEVGTLPDGFLANRPSDFNKDGLPEIVLMPYINNQTFGPVEIWERSTTGTFSKVHTTTENFLPWSIGDLTTDGNDDLVGASILQLMAYQKTTSNPFPSQRILNLSNTWGGEIADVDGDGINNIVARSGSDRGIRILQRESDGAIREQSFISDPTIGSGDLGTRFVIADFDGDGNTEILTGDADGDLWITEYRNNTYVPTWQSSDGGDARWVGGGTDIDNDGQIEFAIARATTDSNDEFYGYWDLEIYSATGPDTYAKEWSMRLTGVATTGNGIISGDADGDGHHDLIVSLRPDLYVFRSDTPNLYRPVWHTETGLMHRPVLADLDANGQPEILYNYNNAVRIAERSDIAYNVVTPQIITARPLDTSRAEIRWMQTPEAISYRIYRATGDSTLVLHKILSDSTSFIDSMLVPNQAYHYQIGAILSDITEYRSAIVSITPNPSSPAITFSTLNDYTLALDFATPVHQSTANPQYFELKNPPIGRPTSAILDRSGKRIVLTFSEPLFTIQNMSLAISGGQDLHGTPLPHATIIAIIDTTGSSQILSQADHSGNGIIDFPDFIAFAQAFGTGDARFDFNQDGIVNFPDFITFAQIFGKSVT